MAKPILTYLSKEELESIHTASIRLLEKTGARFPHKPALDLFREGGASVDYNTSVVKIPGGKHTASPGSFAKSHSLVQIAPGVDVALVLLSVIAIDSRCGVIVFAQQHALLHLLPVFT